MGEERKGQSMTEGGWGGQRKRQEESFSPLARPGAIIQIGQKFIEKRQSQFENLHIVSL